MGTPTRVCQGHRDGTIYHTWNTNESDIRYEGVLDLPGSDHILQLVTVSSGVSHRAEQKQPLGYSWAMLDRYMCVAKARYLI